jgi:hypothetical protein
MSRAAKATKALRFMTPGRLYVYDPILERLAQALEDMAAALGPCGQAAHTMVGPRHRARHRHVAPADQPHIGDGVMGGTKGPGRDQGRPVAREAGDTVEARGLDGLSQGHGRQDGSEQPASLDVPASGGPRRRRLRSKCPHRLPFRESFSSGVPQGRPNRPSVSAPPPSLLTAAA